MAPNRCEDVASAWRARNMLLAASCPTMPGHPYLSDAWHRTKVQILQHACCKLQALVARRCVRCGHVRQQRCAFIPPPPGRCAPCPCVKTLVLQAVKPALQVLCFPLPPSTRTCGCLPTGKPLPLGRCAPSPNALVFGVHHQVTSTVFPTANNHHTEHAAVSLRPGPHPTWQHHQLGRSGEGCVWGLPRVGAREESEEPV